ncbi:hypothetical protein MTO96_004512 [Rhipicephalus appendiculatus]
MEAIELLRPGLHFLVVYVGGNDLGTRQSAEEIADGIKCVLKCASTEAKKVLWYAMLPRLHEGTEARHKRKRVNSLMKTNINTLESCVYINMEDRFLAGKTPKPAFYAVGGIPHIQRTGSESSWKGGKPGCARHLPEPVEPMRTTGPSPNMGNTPVRVL